MTEIEKIITAMTQRFETTLKEHVSRERQKTFAAQTKVTNWRERAKSYRRELTALRKAQK